MIAKEPARRDSQNNLPMCIHVVSISPSQDKLQVPSGKFISEKNELLQKLNDCSDTLFHHNKIDVKQLARLMHMSRPTLYRKLKGIMDLTPNEWINETRMNRAAELLAEGRYKASQVARLLGFTSQSSFGKKFLKQFKVTPASYQRLEVTTRQL